MAQSQPLSRLLDFECDLRCSTSVCQRHKLCVYLLRGCVSRCFDDCHLIGLCAMPRAKIDPLTS